jgi:hypothetical protein
VQPCWEDFAAVVAAGVAAGVLVLELELALELPQPAMASGTTAAVAINLMFRTARKASDGA